MELETLVRKHRSEIRPVADAVEASSVFDLRLPCALLTDKTAVQTTVGGLLSHLPCSNALASPAIERFLALRQEVGFDCAFEQCSLDDDEGEEFCRAWDESQADLTRGVLVTLDDLVAMTAQAREGWKKNPRQLLVVAVSGSGVHSGLVPTDLINA